jgi:hypothetical protein
MKRRFHVPHYLKALRSVAILFFGVIIPAIHAQETALKDQQVVLDITTRVAQQQKVTMNSTSSFTTMSGKPVSVRLEGKNTLIVVHFIPFLSDKGEHLLVTQSQIIANVPGEGGRGQTAIQSMPVKFGEQVFFLPLGDVEPRIEMQIALRPYTDKDAETAIPARRGAGKKE